MLKLAGQFMKGNMKIIMDNIQITPTFFSTSTHPISRSFNGVKIIKLYVPLQFHFTRQVILGIFCYQFTKASFKSFRKYIHWPSCIRIEKEHGYTQFLNRPRRNLTLFWKIKPWDHKSRILTLYSVLTELNENE